MVVENVHIDDPMQWFALRVKSQCERLVSSAISGKGFEGFLPLYSRRTRWSDRFKSVELPLFPGYVFCRLDPRLRLPVLTIPGVLHFVGIGRVPVPIEPSEIAAVRLAVESGLFTEPWPFLDVGQWVRLEAGPLAGLEGILAEVRNRYRVIVSVTLLQRSVSVEVDRDWVAPLSARRAPAYAGVFAT